MTATPSPEVDAYFAELEHPLLEVALGLREVLLDSHPEVVESIKWKAPNYEVADDFATLSLRRPTAVQLVLHTGAKVKPEHPEVAVGAPAKLLKWPDRNRAVASFCSIAEFEDARGALAGIVRSWAAQVRADIEAALPDATVSTQADLAASVSGSLATASSLVAGLGTWLSVLVLAVAFLIAVLFTVSGVARRTREFGTLKAIGWSNRQVLRQVMGESLVQGLIGGALGIALGLGGIAIVNLIASTLSTGTAAAGGAGEGMPAGGPGGEAAGGAPGGMPGQVVQTATDIVLNLPVNVPMIGLAVGLAVAGGLVAGAIGGWRASRLRPAEALRSIA